MVVVVASRSPGGVVLPLLLAALLLACTATAGNSSTICDTAKCGKGTCSEVPGIIPILTGSYKCTCDPGWLQPTLFNHTALPFSPCIIPKCSFSSACFILTTPTPPPGIPLADPCVAVNCGQGGDCEKGVGFGYQCRCQPGFKNLLDDPSMPCIGGSCKFGADCAKLGISPAAPAAAPIGNDLYFSRSRLHVTP